VAGLERPGVPPRPAGAGGGRIADAGPIRAGGRISVVRPLAGSSLVTGGGLIGGVGRGHGRQGSHLPAQRVVRAASTSAALNTPTSRPDESTTRYSDAGA